MSAPEWMLDTDICIYIQRRKPPTVLAHFEKMRPGQSVISVVTWGELLYGGGKSRDPESVLRKLHDFSALIPVCPMPAQCGEYYGEARAGLEKQGLPIGNNDLWIAAHALSLGLTLVTNNIREFGRIPGLKSESWV